MKIAQVNSYYHPFMIGGAEWYVRNISNELVKAGHQVTVITANQFGGEKALADEEFEGVRIRRVPLKLDLSYRLKLWDGLAGELRNGDFDIVHTYDYAQMHSVDSLKAAQRQELPSALTVFDVHSAIPRAWYKRRAMKFLDRYFAGITFPLATRILIRARNLIDGLPGLDGMRDKVRVSPSGVRDESFGTFSGERFRERHSIDGSPLVLFMGRLNPLKGPQYLINAVSTLLGEFPKVTAILVGPDQSGFRGELERMVSERGLSSHVRFTGMISNFEEKMEAYAACDIFVLPTSYEGTSQAIFEAMSQGKPVVATRVGGIPVQVEDGKEGFLVDYGDSAALAEKIALILRDDGLRDAMAANARKKAFNFRYSVLAKGLQLNYAEMLQSDGN